MPDGNGRSFWAKRTIGVPVAADIGVAIGRPVRHPEYLGGICQLSRGGLEGLERPKANVQLNDLRYPIQLRK
jgi:hypothetical protein